MDFRSAAADGTAESKRREGGEKRERLSIFLSNSSFVTSPSPGYQQGSRRSARRKRRKSGGKGVKEKRRHYGFFAVFAHHARTWSAPGMSRGHDRKQRPIRPLANVPRAEKGGTTRWVSAHHRGKRKGERREGGGKKERKTIVGYSLSSFPSGWPRSPTSNSKDEIRLVGMSRTKGERKEGKGGKGNSACTFFSMGHMRRPSVVPRDHRLYKREKKGEGRKGREKGTSASLSDSPQGSAATTTR